MTVEELIQLAENHQPTEEEMKAMFERADKVQEHLDKIMPLQLP